MFSEDYKDILRLLQKEKVKFLVVGAYALAAQGYPRTTGDIDIWVEADLANARKVYKALAIFGAPLKDISEETFAAKDVIYQIGLPPRRIDLMTEIDGVSFSSAYKNKKIVGIDNLKIPFLSLKDIIRNKKATGREKDQLDLKNIRKID